MLQTTIIASVIALLAGLATFYGWQHNKVIAVVTALVCAVSAAVAVIVAFAGTVVMIMRIIPILLLVFGIWLVWKAATRERV